MRRETILFALLLVGCGTDASSGSADVDGSADGASSSDGASGLDGGHGGDGASGDGGQVDAAGKPSDPGMVECGSGPCNVATDYCCTNVAGAPGGKCIPNDGGASACAGFDWHCNETADCDAGSVCCIEQSAFESICQLPGSPSRPCTDTDLQLCRTDADCTNGGGCSVKTCLTQSLQVCGSPTRCN